MPLYNSLIPSHSSLHNLSHRSFLPPPNQIPYSAIEELSRCLYAISQIPWSHISKVLEREALHPLNYSVLRKEQMKAKGENDNRVGDEDEIEQIKTEIKSKIGRKKKEKTISDEQLMKIIVDVVEKINKVSLSVMVIAGRPRVDSKKVAVVRILKKIPMMIHKLLLTDSQVRTNNVEENNRNYKRIFKEGFLKLVYKDKELEREEEKNLYKEFLSLGLPIEKVLNVIKLEYGESIDQKKFIKETRNASMTSKTQKSKAFILICKKIVNLNDEGKIQLNSEASKILNELYQNQ